MMSPGIIRIPAINGGLWPSLGIFIIFITAAMPMTAESQTSVKINSYAAVSTGADGELDFYGIGSGKLTIKSAKNRDVKGEFSLNALAGTQGIAGPLAVDVYRAFIQMDFPYLRITTGKARLSWGDGIYFNAGDRLYGSTSLTAGLSSSVFRDEARWLLGTYIPFGMFSFVEAVALPPDFVAPTFNEGLVDSNPGEDYYDIEKTDAGFRVVTEAVNTKFEAGYLYDGDTGFHEPYISLQGYLLVDWHFSAASRVDSNNAEDSFKENMEISTGVYHALYPQSGPTIGFRLEGLIRPYKEWEETPLIDSTDAAMALATDPLYSLFLYPEISVSGGSISAVLNGLYSPVDNSAMISLYGRWKIFQGLTLFGAANLQAGESTDLFGWDRQGDRALTLGAEYVY